MTPLSDRQGKILHAVVSSYIGAAAPVSSETIAGRLPGRLSPQTVRNTLAELGELGLVAKPHTSAGRIPTERGLRVFVDQLLAPGEIGPGERREIEGRLGRGPGVAHAASRLLSERTRQLGFVLAPRFSRMVLRHVSFVRVSSERVMAVLISRDGRAYQRLIEEPGSGDQAHLDRMAALLNERVAGRTLAQVRAFVLCEAAALRSRAERLLERVLRPTPGEADAGPEAVVVATRVALLDQPELRDPERLRGLLRSVEEQEQLAALLGSILERSVRTLRGVRVALGGEVGDRALRHCAIVAAPYGHGAPPAGALGVIGPERMDYARVIPLVGYLAERLTEMLDA